MENSANTTTKPMPAYPWGNRQEKLVGQLDENTILSDVSLYNRDETYGMQEYDYAKIIHESPLWLFFISLVVAAVCTWAGVSAFNAWVRFDSASALWYLFFACLVASIVGFYVYNKLKRTWLDVFFTAPANKNPHKMRFNVTTLDPLDVSKFQRSLRIVKNGRFSDL
ncbi:MAG: hypothetical protein FWC71_09580 [Defluviitaleaceae bacterium]|nr:hypothetical protein [Defluviitaleaceae bacterium]